jgi:hypothetical protein
MGITEDMRTIEVIGTSMGMTSMRNTANGHLSMTIGRYPSRYIRTQPKTILREGHRKDLNVRTMREDLSTRNPVSNNHELHHKHHLQIEGLKLRRLPTTAQANGQEKDTATHLPHSSHLPIELHQERRPVRQMHRPHSRRPRTIHRGKQCMAKQMHDHLSGHLHLHEERLLHSILK